MAERLRYSIMVTLGLILAAVPLALWVAWSVTVFSIVLAVCALAMAAVIALAWFGEAEEEAAGGGADPEAGMKTLSRAFVEELHRLMPPTYHHRPGGGARFRAAMDRLRAMLERPGP